MPELDFSQLPEVFALTLFAGLATAIGGAVAFFHRKEGRDSGRFLSASLGFSAGVMIYISLVELMAEASGGLRKACGDFQGGLFAMLAFLAGLLITLLIDKLAPEIENPHHVRKQAEVEEAVHATAEDRAKLGRAGILFAVLIGMGDCVKQLREHIEGNFNLGNDRAVLLGALTQCVPYIGFPRAFNTLRCINEVQAELKNREQDSGRA